MQMVNNRLTKDALKKKRKKSQKSEAFREGGWN
jgi:hypothetical protein